MTAATYIGTCTFREPALGSPDVCEVRHPLLVRPSGGELAIQHIAGDDRALALILRQPAPARPCPQALSTHQPFDPVQATRDAFGQHVAPDTPRAVGPVARNMVRLDTDVDPDADLFVAAGAS